MAGLAQRGGSVVPLATAAREKATDTLKHVTLALDGKSPVVVVPDVEVASTAAGVAGAIFFNAGQVPVRVEPFGRLRMNCRSSICSRDTLCNGQTLRGIPRLRSG